MSEPISEPVSPITASGDRFPMESGESELGDQEYLSIRSQPNDPQMPPDDSTSKHEEKSITVQSISGELELRMEPTDPLQPPDQHDRRSVTIYDQLRMRDLVVMAFGSFIRCLY
jgi:hypothetical protein